jgi:hypothetical protein
MRTAVEMISSRDEEPVMISPLVVRPVIDTTSSKCLACVGVPDTRIVLSGLTTAVIPGGSLALSIVTETIRPVSKRINTSPEYGLPTSARGRNPWRPGGRS